MMSILWIAGGLVAALAALAFAWFQSRRAARETVAEAHRQADRLLEEARREGEAKVREAELVAKEKLLVARTEFEAASRKRRTELEAVERRLTQKEDALDKRQEQQDQRDRDLAGREKTLAGRERVADDRDRELERQAGEVRQRLEHVAGLTAQQAREELVRSLENEAQDRGRPHRQAHRGRGARAGQPQGAMADGSRRPAPGLGLRLRDHGLGRRACPTTR